MCMGIQQSFRGFREIAESGYQLRHVCPSLRMEQLDFHWTDFHEIWYLSIFRQSVKKILVSINSDKNNGHITFFFYYLF